MSNEQIDAIIDRAAAAIRAMPIPPMPQRLRPAIRSRRLLRYAAAAVVLLVASAAIGLWGWGHRQENVAFADVVQRLRQMRTVKYRTLWEQTGMKPQVNRDVVALDGHVSRTESIGTEKDGSETIQHVAIYNNGRMLNVDPKSKTAVLTNYNTDGKPHSLADTHTLADLRDINPQLTKPLGRKVFDGEELVGFHIDRDESSLFKRSVDVWVNPKTKLPTRVVEISSYPEADEAGIKDMDSRRAKAGMTKNGELKMDSAEMDRMMEKWPKIVVTRTITQIVWDVPVNDSQFSVEPPKGFKVTEMKVQ